MLCLSWFTTIYSSTWRFSVSSIFPLCFLIVPLTVSPHQLEKGYALEDRGRVFNTIYIYFKIDSSSKIPLLCLATYYKSCLWTREFNTRVRYEMRISPNKCPGYLLNLANTYWSISTFNDGLGKGWLFLRLPCLLKICTHPRSELHAGGPLSSCIGSFQKFEWCTRVEHFEIQRWRLAGLNVH